MKDFETISGLSAPNSLKGCLIALGVSTFTVLIHLVVPIGPIVDAVMIPPIVALAIAIDQPFRWLVDAGELSGIRISDETGYISVCRMGCRRF